MTPLERFQALAGDTGPARKVNLFYADGVPPR